MEATGRICSKCQYARSKFDFSPEEYAKGDEKATCKECEIKSNGNNMVQDKMCSQGHVIGPGSRDGLCERCGGSAINNDNENKMAEENRDEALENNEAEQNQEAQGDNSAEEAAQAEGEQQAEAEGQAEADTNAGGEAEAEAASAEAEAAEGEVA